MTLAVGIGLLQIIFGKFVAGMKLSKQRGVKYGLATLAWGMILIAGCIYLLLPRLLPAVPQVVEYVLLVSMGLSVLVAFLYNTPNKNPIFNIGAILGIPTTWLQDCSGIRFPIFVFLLSAHRG